MQDALLYLLTSFIWGSTWLAIKFQLGVVDPEASIVYRFGLAALALAAYVALRRLPAVFDLRQHGFMALQGVLLFSVNYVLVYLAEVHLTSGLVAIVFSMIIIMNVLFGAALLGNPVRPRVVVGGILGVVGLGVVFWPELRGFVASPSLGTDPSASLGAGPQGGVGLGLLLSLAAVVSASLGNIVSARNQRQGLPVVQTNLYGMAYGALFTLLIALARGVSFGFDPSPGYVWSLAYLALFGSVIAFGSYLTLVGRIGVDRAGYIGVVFPLVALALSTLYEGLSWEASAVVGVALVAAGNALALTRRKRRA